MLKETFLNLLHKYSGDDNLINELWTEIHGNYSQEGRHYHTLAHLSDMLLQLLEIKAEIRNWDAILFSLFYHDVVYNPLQSDNEEQSAELAHRTMRQLSVSTSLMEISKAQILATKGHAEHSDSDTNYFIDADLSVLGQGWEVYSTYFENIRREYSVYPDEIYNAGRKKVLEHFLSMTKIFKTNHFTNTFESQARANLNREVRLL